jgi:hypothetical protein
METYFNLDGEECLVITNADGSIWSGLKSAYDAEQAAKEVKADEAKAE